MMGRHFSNPVFLLTGIALWLTVGSEVHAGFVSLTIADSQQGISIDRGSSTGAVSGHHRSDKDKGNPFRDQNPNPLVITIATLGHNGETGGSMSTGPNNSSGGTTFVADVANDPLCISPHLMSRLVVESASRPPAPFLFGVFRPPRQS